MRDDHLELGKGATMYRDRREKVWPGADFSLREEIDVFSLCLVNGATGPSGLNVEGKCTTYTRFRGNPYPPALELDELATYE